MAYHIGLDIGGTKIAGGLLDGNGVMHAEQILPTPGDYPSFLAACTDVVNHMEAAAGFSATIGVGIAGWIDHLAGSVSAPNLPFLGGKPFRDDLGAALDRPIRLANDANCAALAEAVDGAGAGHNLVLGLIIGTGVGAGIIHRGQLLDGPNGLTGEVGHMPLPFREPEDGPVVACGCKQHGCIEKSVCGGALARLYQFMTGKTADARTISARVTAGDAEAGRVLDRYYEVLAKAMVPLLHAFDPDVIVVSGGMNGLPGLYEEVPKRWGRYCYASHPKNKFVPALHGPMSGLRGAAWLWKMTA